MRFTSTLIGALSLAAIALPAAAQTSRDDREERVQRERERARDRGQSFTYSYSSDEDSERAVLGINTNAGGERDTLGLLISSITPGSPAEKAGLEEGNRIASVNGVSLQLSRADAGEPDMNGVMSRRLTREMRKIKAGDEVSLRVYGNGQFRDVRVKTIAAEDLSTSRRVRMTRDDIEDRAVIGVTASATGSARDTLGIMVSSVAEEGPAEKAGIFEGARIQSINGVDLRVAREDAGDNMVGSTKSSRFVREMGKVKAGDDVELRVYTNGETRTIRVKSARAADVYKESRNGRYFFGGDFGVLAPMPPMPAMPPMPPMPGQSWRSSPRVLQLRPGAVRAPIFELNYEDAIEDAVEGALSGAGASVQTLETIEDGEPVVAPHASETPRAVRVPAAAPAASWMVRTSWAPVVAPSAPAGTLVLPGLRASAMDRDLAAYFGDDESVGDGLLIIEADESWDALRVGDVIVAVNGKPVRAGETRDIASCLDRSRDNRVTVVRKGRRETLLVRAV